MIYNLHKFKLVSVDNGFCRVLFQTKNSDNQKIYYCLQEDWRDKPVVLYRCTQPPWCEPSHEVKLQKNIGPIEFEMPEGNSRLEIKVKEWILENNYHFLDKYIGVQK